MKKKKQQGSCESCMYYEYDEDYECYVCEVNLDEDEMARFMEDRFYDTPLVLNLGVLVITFGLTIRITMASIIGVAIALLIYRYL